jgi:hypothetical protein
MARNNVAAEPEVGGGKREEEKWKPNRKGNVGVRRQAIGFPTFVSPPPPTPTLPKGEVAQINQVKIPSGGLAGAVHNGDDATGSLRIDPSYRSK